MIKLDNVSKFYYSKGVISSGFSKVSLNFDIGEFVAITGESGSGKSTLLNVISGLDTYEEGEMYIDGGETSHYTEKDFEDYRRRYIGNIFQNFNLVNSYTVYQNIEMVLLLNGAKRSDVKKIVNDLIDKVGLSEYRRTKASKLSGGQKQRVAIARALAKDTPVIIADEPTGNLDSESAAGIIELLSEISKDKLVIIVTHNYDQVENYVTRKIKMHDGKVIEDLHLKDHEVAEVVPKTEYRNIGILSQIRLGTRNAFNIPVKFILLTFVFLFIASSVLTEVALFKHETHENGTSGYNNFFQDTSDDRIILKKNDKTSFTDEDYKKIAAVSNVKNIVENDLLLDTTINLTDKSDFFFYGNMLSREDCDYKTVDVGKMPTSDDEILLLGTSNSYYLSGGRAKELIGKTVYTDNMTTGEPDMTMPLKVAGIKYVETSELPQYSDGVSIASAAVLEKIQYRINQRYSTESVLFDGKTYGGVSNWSDSFQIYENAKVAKGECYLAESSPIYAKDGKRVGKDLKLTTKNMYYTDEVALKVTKTVDKAGMKKYLGITKDQDMYQYAIFLNPEDYSKLYQHETYQSSVMVKDATIIDSTEKSLAALGFDTLIASKTNVSDGTSVILQIMSIIVTAGFAIVLFFISYFVIRIILKSRNVYYSTIRMLGANVKVCRNLLITDLIVDANIACLLTGGIFSLLANKFPENFIIEAITTFMGIGDYAIIYAIVIVISALISVRYASKLFKKSTMTTIKEEV